MEREMMGSAMIDALMSGLVGEPYGERKPLGKRKTKAGSKRLAKNKAARKARARNRS